MQNEQENSNNPAETEDFDLGAELSKKTDVKKPGEKPVSSFKDEKEDNFWGDEEGINPEVTFSEEKKTETSAQNTASSGTSASEPPKAPLTEKDYKNGAEITVGMIELIQKTILAPAHKWKFKRKFTEKEVDRINELAIEDADPNDLKEEEDIRLKKKFDRLFKRLEKNLKALSFDSTEEEEMIDAWTKYYRTKQKTMDPSVLVILATLKNVGNRVVDVIFE